ncbi:3-methylcrotonyl-CoA carboxylase [Aliidiomarina sedimenti]|uniref:3-methylcrotonyl-CoA carboxylase n=1 Tax=Aliidiomarina sedimenti TaxID=1933879 RepID=A0ABY0C2P8_9GAMM|nr:acetyl/propionyl/methylcrotonyl-CoA carboxylase subunit alpha [Aliidiomarina sedimenti]RUO32077.1 3-methylcrotonyl-CoA carboxylase [Aliidiomarina sedimenti]
MFNKILIANRGEIACRVIRTAQRMGIQCVAVYSDADRHAEHVQMADEAYYIGASPSSESYLVMEKIIDAANRSGAQAIHPGYGFLSENEAFADLCASNDIAFVGPPASAIAAMGSKSAAKSIMDEAGVPLVPGYHGSEQAEDKLREEAERIGYPVLLKAAYGGGGKGMREVHKASQFSDALASAKREANASFGNDKMLVEKFIVQPRHVEIQVFCDEHGNAVYLAERDCSVQRRHQKVLEEAPAPALGEETRAAMGDAAVRAAQAIDYRGAGTVEFLLDANNDFFFMEMNTRLQVEHPVTEMITGQDLVEWQLIVASGGVLPLSQDQVTLHGHAFEARIYAEDPQQDFLPSTGRIEYLRTPAEDRHVRIDSGVRQGDEVSPYYDPMIAKLIVWDEDRDRALLRLQRALREYHLVGPTTNVDYLHRLASHKDFVRANLSTQFIEQHGDALLKPAKGLESSLAHACIGAAIALHQRPAGSANPWQAGSAWRLNQPALQHIELVYDDELLRLEVASNGDTFMVKTGEQTVELHARLSGERLEVTHQDHQFTLKVALGERHYTLFSSHGRVNYQLVDKDSAFGLEEDAGTLTAPMNGTIVSVNVEVGDKVEKDQPLVVMEAMKMEYTIKATVDGTVEQVFFQAGELVSDGAELIALAADE